jgi:hypothetical protein
LQRKRVRARRCCRENTCARGAVAEKTRMRAVLLQRKRVCARCCCRENAYARGAVAEKTRARAALLQRKHVRARRCCRENGVCARCNAQFMLVVVMSVAVDIKVHMYKIQYFGEIQHVYILCM